MKNYELQGEYVHNKLVINPINHIVDYDEAGDIIYYCGNRVAIRNLLLEKNKATDNCSYCAAAFGKITKIVQ